MSTYSFLSDLLHTFQSLNDWIKLVVLLIPPCFLLCGFGLLLHHRATIRVIEASMTEHEHLSIRDIFDRMEYLRTAPLAIDNREDINVGSITSGHRHD